MELGFVSPSALPSKQNGGERTREGTRGTSSSPATSFAPSSLPTHSTYEDLLSSARLPPALHQSSPKEVIEWCLPAIVAICPQEVAARRDFTSELFSALFALPTALPLLQLIIQQLEVHAKQCRDPHLGLLELLQGIHWPLEAPFCCAAVFCAFSLSQAALALPLLLQLYTPKSFLAPALSYLSQYFSTLLSTSLHSFIEEALQTGDSTSLANLLSILECDGLFGTVIQEWTSARGETTATTDKLAEWLLRLASVPLSSPHASENPLLALLVAQVHKLDNIIVALLVAAGKQKDLDKTAAQLFPLLHTRLSEGLVDHICHVSSQIVPCLHRIVHAAAARQFVPKNYFSEWVHFDAVAALFPLCHDTSFAPVAISSSDMTKIDALRRTVPVDDFSFDLLDRLLSSSTSSASKMADWSMEEVAMLLKNVWYALEREEAQPRRSSRLPLSWFLSLIDQGSFQVVHLAVDILESLIARAPTIKLHLFAAQLLNYYESLAMSATREDDLEDVKKANEKVQNGMDIDEVEKDTDNMPGRRRRQAESGSAAAAAAKGNGNHQSEPMTSHLLPQQEDGMLQSMLHAKPSTEEKRALVKRLFSSFSCNPMVIASLLTDMAAFLCTTTTETAPEEATLRQLPLWTHHTAGSEDQGADMDDEEGRISNTAKASSKASNNDSFVADSLSGPIDPTTDSNSMDLSSPLETSEHTQHLQLLSNVRRRLKRSSPSSDLTSLPSHRSSLAPNGSSQPLVNGQPINTHHQSSSTAMEQNGFLHILLLADHLISLSSSTASSTPVLLSPTTHPSTPPPSLTAQPHISNINFLAKFVDAFLFHIDGKYPPVQDYSAYLQVLPKKSVFDRDRSIEQLFLQRPIFWQVLTLFSRSPLQLRRCRHILFSLLVNLIGNWNIEMTAKAKDCGALYEHTMIFMNLLDCLPDPVYARIAGLHVIFAYCSPSDIVLILCGIFDHLMTRFTNKATNSELIAWVLKPVRFVLRKNIHLLSDKALDLYIRTKGTS